MSKVEFINDLNEMYNNYFIQCDKENECDQSNVTCRYNYSQITDGYDIAKNRILLVGLEVTKDGFKDGVAVKSAYDWANYACKREDHWKATILTVIKYCKKYDNEKMKEIAENIEMLYEEAKGCEFAFTNLVKCYDSKETSKFREKAMEKCVAKFFFNEVKKFDPDLIVIQTHNGNNDRREIIENRLALKDKIIEKVYGKEFEFEKNGKRYEHSLVKYLIENKELSIIYSIHPNPSNNPYKFSDYSDILYKLIDIYFDKKNK